MIRFDQVSFAYNRKNVLEDVSFSVGSSERVAILGGSGYGKTTILRLILGLIRPDAGRMLIDGDDITGKAEEELRVPRMKFSIVFQEGALFDSLNVKENVAFCLREYSHLTEEEIEQRVREILRIVDVESALFLKPEELSGGMHRRVAIARSLAGSDPRMFLYDEPTSGLDPVNADNICKLIVDLAKDGKGFIIVTHKVMDALKVGERFMFLKDGKIQLDGNRQELIGAEDPDIQQFLSELRPEAERQGVKTK
jgi:phospholipid/cholesterol/gamma-HCH transport system ATP-binding protein